MSVDPLNTDPVVSDPMAEAAARAAHDPVVDPLGYAVDLVAGGETPPAGDDGEPGLLDHLAAGRLQRVLAGC